PISLLTYFPLSLSGVRMRSYQRIPAVISIVLLASYSHVCCTATYASICISSTPTDMVNHSVLYALLKGWSGVDPGKALHLPITPFRACR
ncbi:hypothetical protein BDN70DRAFT_889022, partial [Pholiota conissans]